MFMKKSVAFSSIRKFGSCVFSEYIQQLLQYLIVLAQQPEDFFFVFFITHFLIHIFKFLENFLNIILLLQINSVYLRDAAHRGIEPRKRPALLITNPVIPVCLSCACQS